tara:strand:+ start:2461 stop:7560 length:5100 start_codon:yes stop_codon:yes gene_type:complete
MPKNISTYWAKNVKIKTLRGNKFEFVLNVKNEDGSNYSFPEGHEAFFAAFKTTSNASGLIMPTSSGSAISFDTLVEEGKITVTTFGEEDGFHAIAGTYNYILFTYNPDDVGVNLSDLLENIIPNYHSRVGWMSEELTELWTSVYENDVNVVENGYYDEWFHVVGAEGLYPCYNPEWKVLQVNQELGSNLYYEEPLIDFPYANNDYLDNNDIWINNKFTYKDGMTDLLFKAIIHRKNIVKCIFDERQYIHKWSVVPVPVKYNVYSTPPITPPSTQLFENSSAYTNIEGDSFKFHTGHQFQSITNIIAGDLYLNNNLISYFNTFNTINQSDYTTTQTLYLDGYEVTDFFQNNFTQGTNTNETSSFINLTSSEFLITENIEIAANYVPGDLIFYNNNNVPVGNINSISPFLYQLGLINSYTGSLSSYYGNSLTMLEGGSSISPHFNPGQGYSDWRRIKPVKVGLPYAPIESLEDLNVIMNPPPADLFNNFTVIFMGGVEYEYPDVFPWWGYRNSINGYNNAYTNPQDSSGVIFSEGEELTQNWLDVANQNNNSFVDWDEDYLIYPKTSYFLDMVSSYPELGHIPTDALGIEEPANVMLNQIGNSYSTSSPYQNFPVNTNTPGWNLIPYLSIDSTMFNYLSVTNQADLPGFLLGDWNGVTYWGAPSVDAYEQEVQQIPYSYTIDGIEITGSVLDIGYALDENGSPIINTLEESEELYGIQSVNEEGEIQDNSDFNSNFLTFNPIAGTTNSQGTGVLSAPLPNSINTFMQNNIGLNGEVYEPWWLLTSSEINNISEVSSVFSNDAYGPEDFPVTAASIGLHNGTDWASVEYDYNALNSPEFNIYIKGIAYNAMSFSQQFFAEGTEIGVGVISAQCRITRPDGTGFPVKPEFNEIFAMSEFNSEGTYIGGPQGANVSPYGLGYETIVNSPSITDQGTLFPSEVTTIIPVATTMMPNFKPAFAGTLSNQEIVNNIAGEPGVYEFLFKFCTPFGGVQQNLSDTSATYLSQEASTSLIGANDTGWDFIDWDNAGDRKFVVEYRLMYLKTMSPPYQIEVNNWEFTHHGFANTASNNPVWLKYFGWSQVANINPLSQWGFKSFHIGNDFNNISYEPISIIPYEGSVIEIPLETLPSFPNPVVDNEFFNGNSFTYNRMTTVINIRTQWTVIFGGFYIDINKFVEGNGGWEGASQMLGAPQGVTIYSSEMWGSTLPVEAQARYYPVALPLPGQSIFETNPSSISWSNKPQIEFTFYYENLNTGETGTVTSRYNYFNSQNSLADFYDNTSNGATNGTSSNEQTPEQYWNWHLINALTDVSIAEQVQNQNELAFKIPRYKMSQSKIRVSGNFNPEYYEMSASNCPNYMGILKLANPENGGFDYSGAPRRFNANLVMPYRPDWQGHQIKLTLKSNDIVEPRIWGGPPEEYGGNNPWWEMEGNCIIKGNVIYDNSIGVGAYAIDKTNCHWTLPLWTPEIQADWPTDENGNYIPQQHPNGKGTFIYGLVWPYWMLGQDVDKLKLTRFIAARRHPHNQTDMPMQGDPSEIIEQKAEIRATGTGMTMDLMAITLGNPPELNLFEYTIKITKADNPEFIYHEFDIDASIPFSNTDVLSAEFEQQFSVTDFSQPSTYNGQTSIFLDEMGILDGQELQFHIKPKEGYRQYDINQESYIRLAGTYFSTTWGNNSYLNEDTLVPVPAHYWMYGDFVVEKNNKNQ